MNFIPHNKVCKSCSIEKGSESFRRHNRNGLRGICRQCENLAYRQKKLWSSPKKRAYQKHVRLIRRGFSLSHDAKRRAREKDIPFDLDWRQIQKRIDAGHCEVTGIPFDLTKAKAWNAPSLDQIIPRAGYTTSNTRVVLYALNVMASDWGLDVVVKIADAIRAPSKAYDGVMP